MPGKINGEILDVAIIGQGIIGLTLALGLIKRGINVKVYEQASSLRVTGAGVAFTANAIQCMNLLDPQIVDALRSVATSNGDPANPNDYLRWVDGYSSTAGQDPLEEKLLFKLYAGTKGFEGCHRAHFVEALAALMPEGVVHYSKRLDKIYETGDSEKVVLSFHDGTTASADAVIGCDGINSRVREHLFGSDNPISHPNYSHKAAYRGLIPMDKAVEALGEYKAKNQHMHLGPKAHIVHFPVVNQTMVNVVAFVSDSEKWPDDNKLDVLAERADLEAAFSDWGLPVRSIVQLLPEQLSKWAVFDTYDHPIPYYSAGQVCLAGDAAHAAAPHHGAGAGVGIEDALCLASVFEEALKAPHYTDTLKSDIISAAFESYNAVRHERTQWLVQSSREVCDIYEWANPLTGDDPEKCLEEIMWRSHKIWYFDFIGMVQDVKKDFNQRIQGNASKPMPIEAPVAVRL